MLFLTSCKPSQKIWATFSSSVILFLTPYSESTSISWFQNNFG